MCGSYHYVDARDYLFKIRSKKNPQMVQQIATTYFHTYFFWLCIFHMSADKAPITGHLHQNFLTCSLIVRLHKYIICFDLEMYFLVDNNMTTTVVVINKLMYLVKF